MEEKLFIVLQIMDTIILLLQSKLKVCFMILKHAFNTIPALKKTFFNLTALARYNRVQNLVGLWFAAILVGLM